METVLRAAAIYLLLMVVFKIAGRRTLLQMTSFDLILLLIISEATQQALLGDDFSVTGASLTIITLITIDIVLGKLKARTNGGGRTADSGGAWPDINAAAKNVGHQSGRYPRGRAFRSGTGTHRSN